MHFDLMTPCADCPFRQEGGVRLSKARAKEISGTMLSAQGSTFSCHKHSHGLGLPKAKPEQHCAGALIFAEKSGNQTQLMRIAHRLRIYDPDRLMDPQHAATHAEVIDSRGEFLAIHAQGHGRSEAKSPLAGKKGTL